MQHSKRQLLNDILSVLQTIKEDKPKLEKLHDFIVKEIYEETEEMEKPDIPGRFKKVVAEVADSLTAGYVCFINPETLESEDIPLHALEDYTAMTGEGVEDFNMKHYEWERFIEIRPPESYDSFKIMERFADKVPDTGLREKLIDALNRKKPFAHFKRIIDDSDYRQDWFGFRQARLEEYVYETLTNEIDEE